MGDEGRKQMLQREAATQEWMRVDKKTRKAMKLRQQQKAIAQRSEKLMLNGASKTALLVDWRRGTRRKILVQDVFLVWHVRALATGDGQRGQLLRKNERRRVQGGENEHLPRR